MATIAPPPPQPSRASPARPGGSGGSPPPDSIRGGDGRPESGPGSEQVYYTGMWVGLGAIVMVFAAFSSAFVVRKGIADDWQALALPPLLWVNTLVLLASSFTLELARRNFPNLRPFRLWWMTTLLLGGLFLLGQFVVWRQLAAQGIYVSTNPSSSFFYLLTASHGVHLAGGLSALLWLAWRLREGSLTRVAVGVTSLYWHFMDGLWVYLMLLLLIGR